ncbi:SAM-dependent methyltransferase [Branchiibius sp. NY16-3462-2]|nr:SAM-dependent methyltransferase [Branchiibius sp. NY16-3462-2]
MTPVGLLAQQLDDLVVVAQHESPDLVDRLTRARDLAEGLDGYVERSTTAATPELRDLAARTAAHDWNQHRDDGGHPGLEQEMLSGHVEGQFLRMLTAATRARRVLEIGMFTGYSALAMAQALPSGGLLVACEIDPGASEFARTAFDRAGLADRLDIRIGPAEHTLAHLADDGATFDLVFIDADKAGYHGYLDAVLDLGLLADGGLVVVDNTLMQGLPWTAPGSTPNAAAIEKFNEFVAADERVEQVLLPVRDGITLIRRSPRKDR